MPSLSRHISVGSGVAVDPFVRVALVEARFVRVPRQSRDSWMPTEASLSGVDESSVRCPSTLAVGASSVYQSESIYEYVSRQRSTGRGPATAAPRRASAASCRSITPHPLPSCLSAEKRRCTPTS